MATKIIFVASLVLTIAGMGIAAAQNETKPTNPVKVDSGLVRGLIIGDNDGIHVFKGLPFAAPPVGNLRWRPPVPPKSHEDVLDCFEFGNASLQETLGGVAAIPGFELGADDYIPARPTRRWALDFDLCGMKRHLAASPEVKVEGRVEGIEKARRTLTVMGLKIRITRAMKIDFD